MAIREFDFTALQEMDGGRLLEVWREAWDRAIRDVENRPGNKKPRKVVLEASVTPFHDGSVVLHNVEFQIKDSTPTRVSKTYSMAARTRTNANTGQRQMFLVFNDMSEDDARQRSLDGLAAAEEE